MLIEILLFFTSLYILLVFMNRKPANLPPGIWGPPLIGLRPIGKQAFVDLMNEFRNKIGGGIYSCNLGSRVAIFITDYVILKNAFAKLELSGRPSFFSVKTFGDNLGISMAVGKIWHSNRRLAMKFLRDRGMGKSSMEEVMIFEANSLASSFEKSVGKPTQINWTVNVAILNILWNILADTRFEIDDKGIIEFAELNYENFQILSGNILFLDFYPWANFLPNFIKDGVFHAKDLVNNKEKFKHYLMEYIDKLRETLDKENPRNFIDMYLIDADKTKDPEYYFKKNWRNLVNVLINFFSGSEVAAHTFRWLINYMAMNPKIQEKLHQEIDKNVPQDRTPTLDDRDNLPYVAASVQEALRKSSVVLYGIPHATTEDAELEGYHIPKGAVVFSCLEDCNHDPKYWEKPNEFYPEHFIDKDGKFYCRENGFSTFSVGKRICIGKVFSEMNLFIFAAIIFQKFKFSPAPGEKITYAGESNNPFFNFPMNHELIIEKRF